ncbi:MAG: ATP-binding protein [Acidobacteriota bacterium]|nr:ATP-binding protein [Acidobacteriota bacterium]
MTRTSDDVAQSIHSWVTVTANQAEGLSRFPTVARAIESRKAANVEHSREFLSAISGSSSYLGIYLIGSDGKQLMETLGAPELDPWVKGQASTAGKAALLTLFNPGVTSGYPKLAFVQPVYKDLHDASSHVGALVLVTRPEAIQNLVEPLEESRVRTLLLARNRQGQLVYFSRTVHVDGQVPHGLEDSLAEAAVQGEKHFVLRRTPDGQAQYAVSGYLHDLGWGTITRAWRSTVLASFYVTMFWSITVYLALCGLVVTLAIAMWRHQQVSALRTDLEQRRQFDEELRQSEELFNTVFHCAPVGLALLRIADGRIVEANDNLASMTNFTRKDLLGKTTLELGIWEDPEERVRLMADLENNRVVRNFRFCGHIKARQKAELELSAEILLIRHERYYLVALQDVTPQVVLQEQLRQAQKLEAVGLLAGSVAHDFNNLLMAISSQAELLMLAPDLERVAMKAQRILKATESAAQLTRKLLAFGRKQELAATSFELGGFLVHVCELIGDLLPRDIRMECRVDHTPCWVRTDRGQLEQTVINLVINARDAMPDGGKLVLSTSAMTIATGESVIHDGVPEGAYALLMVADTGTGIAPEHREHIFEPFFTTKPKGRGTGLGLAMVYGIVRQSNGHLRVRSTVGAGTTFSIYLPLIQTPVTANSIPVQALDADEEGGCRINGTVLLVDDEEMVRGSVQSFLEQAGLTVMGCSNGEEAMAAASGLGEQLALLVTDVVMPGMSGTELASALTETHPRLPVIFMSGYAAGEANEFHFQRACFLQKPFTRMGLIDAVCRMAKP